MMIVYGSCVSYYTGKLESYLRYKGIEYRRKAMPYDDPESIMKHVGALQHPVVDRGDGRWMSDTTPMLLQLEQEHPENTILPGNPVVGFIARLIEDYADEWLWRPAMHYRWSYQQSRVALSEILAEELRQNGPPYPKFILRKMLTHRQRTYFVIKDGVNGRTWDHVEQGYLNALDNMTGMLRDRPFLLGNAPSLADFGLMAPMLRHFSQDPVPAEIMRSRAPAVYEWVARMWNVKPAEKTKFCAKAADEWQPMLKEICETHLEQLTANAKAYGTGQKHFQMTVQGCLYTDMPVSRYRVWCLEKLRLAFASLSAANQGKVRKLLPHPQAEILWADSIDADSGYDRDNHLPFGKAINVYGTGTP